MELGMEKLDRDAFDPEKVYVVKYARASGWPKYDENTSPAVGAYFNMP